MPWCDDCSKFWNPNSLPPDGTCPSCGRVIAEPPDTTVPWHFWVLVAALVIYLGWRLVQLIGWLNDNGHGVWAVAVVAVTVAGCGWLGVWLVRRRGDGSGAETDAESGAR